jgi:hypothetical protein
MEIREQKGRPAGRLFAVACRHGGRWRAATPGLKAVAGTPICEQQMG